MRTTWQQLTPIWSRGHFNAETPKKIWDQGKVQERMRSRRNQMFWQAEAVRRPDPGHHSIKSPLPNKPEDWEGWGCWSNPTKGRASDEERELVNCRRWFLTLCTGHSVEEIDAFLSTKRQYIFHQDVIQTSTITD